MTAARQRTSRRALAVVRTSRRRPNRVEPTSGNLADARTLENVINEMADKFLLCRDGRHLFAKYRTKDTGDAFEQTSTCGRQCGAVVTRTVSRKGYIVSRKMSYADKDYLLVGFGRATQDTRAKMRLQTIVRTIA